MSVFLELLPTLLYLQTKTVYIHKNCVCMIFERVHYIKKLIHSKHNHLIKIVTGLRRVGKSYMLFNLYKQHLLDNGGKAACV